MKGGKCIGLFLTLLLKSNLFALQEFRFDKKLIFKNAVSHLENFYRKTSQTRMLKDLSMDQAHYDSFIGKDCDGMNQKYVLVIFPIKGSRMGHAFVNFKYGPTKNLSVNQIGEAAETVDGVFEMVKNDLCGENY